VKKRYRLSDDITKNKIGKKNSKPLSNISEKNKLNVDYLKEFNNKDSLIKVSIDNKNQYESVLKIKDTKRESNQLNNEFTNKELILPICLTTKKVSILSTKEIMNLGLIFLFLLIE